MSSVGFTGSRDGMTDEQASAVESLLERLRPSVVHHGDCVGADTAFHRIARAQGARVHLHPPSIDVARGMNEADVSEEPRPYMARNRDIVDASDVLIAAPNSRFEVLRSGTWATVRAARAAGVPVVIVWPDGRWDGATANRRSAQRRRRAVR